MNGFAIQLKHVVRRLMRSPMFTLVTLLTIAIGVGANSAIFSVVNGVLLKPLPYPDPERLISVWQSAPGLGIMDLNESPSDYFTFREENRTFQQFGIWQGDGVSITGLATPERVQAIDVTSGTLDALGIQPVLGRWFTLKDETKGNPETVILAYGYWQRKFGGDPSAIGRRIVADGIAREIIGVMPQSFRFLDEKPELIFPFQFERAKVFLGNFSYQGIARLKPGVTLAQASADVARMIPIVNTKFPPPPGFSAKLFEDAHIQASLRPLKQDVIGDLRKVLWVLMASIGVVLLIACANVANLLLVRAEGRQQELAIRTALGAGSRQIAREFLVESVSLGVLGGAAGLGLAYAALRLLVRLAPASLPRLENITIDPIVLLFTVGLSLLAGVLFGLMPVFKFAAPSVMAALRAGGRTLSQSKESHRARNTLVIAQVALAVILLISSGLMIRTFQALRNVQPGFTGPRELQTLSVYIPESQVKEPERVVRMHHEILRKLSAIPGVSSAAFANSVPTDGNNSTDLLYAEDHPYAEGKLPPLRRFKFVAPGFFQTMGTRLIAGRDYTWTDIYDQRLFVIVSENMARELWHDPAAALGKRIREGMKDSWREIIGVVADVRSDGADQKPPTTTYWPIIMKNFWGEETFVQRSAVFAIRSPRAGSESFLKEVRQAVWSVNPDVPLARVRTMEQVYRGSMARSSFTLVMLAIAGGMALLLGIIGIYGVISYSVSQRTREMGIRIALGARQNGLTAMVVRHGLLLAAAGIALGLVAAAAVTRIMATMLFEIHPVDPITYAAVSIGLLAAAAAASYIPAHRASTVNPVDALRAE
ncbi:MAG TPA: ABC transporter permease [Bryobacteraceae bacterium]|nr:ABC transporter permease [Bryobacteraceae bacterium]